MRQPSERIYMFGIKHYYKDSAVMGYIDTDIVRFHQENGELTILGEGTAEPIIALVKFMKTSSLNIAANLPPFERYDAIRHVYSCESIQ